MKKLDRSVKLGIFCVFCTGLIFFALLLGIYGEPAFDAMMTSSYIPTNECIYGFALGITLFFGFMFFGCCFDLFHIGYCFYGKKKGGA